LKIFLLLEEQWFRKRTGAKKNGLRNSKQKKWFYHLFEFKVPGEVLIAFETEFRRDERVMRFLTVSLDKRYSWAERRRTKLKSTKA
jgi:small subunit ribosomal protein S6